MSSASGKDHEILLGGPAVAVDKVVVGRELDALMQQLDASVLLDREVKDAFLVFSSGLLKIWVDFSHSRGTLLRTEELKRQIEYSSEECQSLLRLAKIGRKVSHEMHGHLQAVIREIDGIGTPEPPISFEHSQQCLNLLFGELHRTTDFLERSSQENNRLYERCVSLDAAMEDDISEYRRLLKDKGTHQLAKKEAEHKFSFLGACINCYFKF